MCNSTFSVAIGGNISITGHIEAQKHKIAFAVNSWSGSTTCIINMRHKKPYMNWPLTVLYHTTPHHTAAIFVLWIAQRVFRRNLQTNFLVQEQSVNQLLYLFVLSLLNNWKMFLTLLTLTVLCIVSNHKYTTLLSIVRYFQGYNLETPVYNRILILAEISVETVDLIPAWIVRAVARYGLDAKVVRLSAGNIITNFRSLQRRSKKMWLPELSQLNRNIIGLCYSVHSVNCAKAPFDSMLENIEVLVTKIVGHFHSYTVFVEHFRFLWFY
jgi:hypothetical protein